MRAFIIKTSPHLLKVLSWPENNQQHQACPLDRHNNPLTADSDAADRAAFKTPSSKKMLKAVIDFKSDVRTPKRMKNDVLDSI